MNTFYFNTGVRPENSSVLSDGEVWKDGVKQIPFDANVPENASLMFLCSNPDLPEGNLDNVMVAKVRNSAMMSDYAYFRV